MKIYAIPTTISAAKSYVAAHHRHNKPPQGALFAVGASCGEGLIGVAIVGRPVARMYDNGETCEITRCCVEGGAPKGACSFLYQACWRAARELGWTRIITYTLKSESGSSLRGAGWKIIAERPARNKAGWANRQGRSVQEVVGMPKLLWSPT